jgi:hypothetical protein
MSLLLLEFWAAGLLEQNRTGTPFRSHFGLSEVEKYWWM